MTFSQALELLKNGKKLRRGGWKNVDHVVAIYPADARDRPYLAAMDHEGHFQAGWLAAQTDLFGDDWCEIP